MNYTINSRKLINQLNYLGKKNLNRISESENLNNLIKFIKINYQNFKQQEIKLVSNSKNIERENVFLNNIDTCKKNKYDYLLNVEVILTLLNEKHRNIIDKMLKIHKYDEIKKKQIYDFLNNLGNYEKNEVIEWMNQNGIESVSYTHLTLPTTPYV